MDCPAECRAKVVSYLRTAIFTGVSRRNRNCRKATHLNTLRHFYMDKHRACSCIFTKGGKHAETEYCCPMCTTIILSFLIYTGQICPLMTCFANKCFLRISADFPWTFLRTTAQAAHTGMRPCLQGTLFFPLLPAWNKQRMHHSAYLL